MRFFRSKILFVAWLLCCGLLVSCKQSQKTSVPSYPVHLVIKSDKYPHFVLGNASQTLTFTERKSQTDYIGYAGVVVSIDALGENYHAHDMACPRCLNREKPVEVVGMYAECPICHEQYDLTYGYAFPTKGISREPLRKYTATYSSFFLSWKLTITP